MGPQRIVVTLVAASVIASACGDEAPRRGRPRTDPETELHSLITAESARSTGAHFSVITYQSTGGEFTVVHEGQGIFDFQRGEAVLELWSAELGLGMKSIFDKTGIYIAAEWLFPELPAGKDWVRVSPSSLRKLVGDDFDINSFLRGDPGQELEFLLTYARTIKNMGRGDGRGANTRHYRMAVSLSRIRGETSELSGFSRTFYKHQIRRVRGEKPLVLDVWIDHRGRVVRETIEIDTRIPTKRGHKEGRFRQTYKWFSYGAPISVTPPPASVTVDSTQLEKR